MQWQVKEEGIGVGRIGKRGRLGWGGRVGREGGEVVGVALLPEASGDRLTKSLLVPNKIAVNIAM